MEVPLPSSPGHLFHTRQGESQGSIDPFYSGHFSPRMLPGHRAGESTFSTITELGFALENWAVSSK